MHTRRRRGPQASTGFATLFQGSRWSGLTANLPGMLNRQRFELEQGVHPDKELQNDWNTLGVDAFEFETLDRLEPKTDSAYDPAEDLCALKEMWIEQLTAAGVPLYRWSRQGKGA